MGTGNFWVFKHGDLQRACRYQYAELSALGLKRPRSGAHFASEALIVMFAPVSHLTKIPVEILEKIFLLLPGQDVIRMEAVRELFPTLCDTVLTLLI